MTPFYPGLAPIEAYVAGGFRFAGMSHRGSILVLPSGIHAWPVAKLDDAKPEDFALVFEDGGIDLLLIGAGAGMRRPPRAVREAFAARASAFDVMATAAAVSTYNVLLDERRRVAAALIAVDWIA